MSYAKPPTAEDEKRRIIRNMKDRHQYEMAKVFEELVELHAKKKHDPISKEVLQALDEGIRLSQETLVALNKSGKSVEAGKYKGMIQKLMEVKELTSKHSDKNYERSQEILLEVVYDLGELNQQFKREVRSSPSGEFSLG